MTTDSSESLPEVQSRATSRRFLRWFLFFVAGLAVTALSYWITYKVDWGTASDRPLVILALPWAVALILAIRRSSWFAYSVGAGLPWVLVLATLCVFVATPAGPPRRDFNAEHWRTLYPDADEARLSMVDDLVDSGVLNALRREEVLELLGPDDSDGKGAIRRGTAWDLVYYLGPDFFPASHSALYLAMQFAGGRVHHYAIITD